MNNLGFYNDELNLEKGIELAEQLPNVKPGCSDMYTEGPNMASFRGGYFSWSSPSLLEAVLQVAHLRGIESKCRYVYTIDMF